MRALRFDGSRAEMADLPVPHATADTAVVRVVLAGVCNTDLELVRGYLGFRGVLGHEFVGVVEDGPTAWHGKRVVGEINFACQACETCRRGLDRHCPSRTVMGIQGADGAFAEYVRVPVRNLHAVPDTVSDTRAVFSEPLAAAFEIIEQISIEPHDDCIVLGDGKLGLLVAQVLAHAGGRVLAVGHHAERLALLERRGIATTLASDWHPDPAPLVIDATGNPQGFALAVAATRPRGTLVLKSTHAAHSPVNLAPLVINEIHVVGSRCGPFPPALHALEESQVDVEALISDRLPLTRAPEALKLAGRPGILKIVMECG